MDKNTQQNTDQVCKNMGTKDSENGEDRSANPNKE